MRNEEEPNLTIFFRYFLNTSLPFQGHFEKAHEKDSQIHFLMRDQSKNEGKSMKNMDIVLCGLGGQGILFMTKILAQSALGKGIPIMGAETHGMAQRGGSVVSHLRLGKVEGSLVRAGTAHILLALEENEAYRNLAFLGKKGSLYVNADPETFPRPEAGPYLEKNEIVSRCTLAGKVAMDLGTPMSANLALIGFFSAFAESPFTYDDLRETVERISPDRFKETNLTVFDTCHKMGLKESS